MADLSVYEFGARLLDANDLDPVYVVLDRADMLDDEDDPLLHRWLVAYWCFYHVGTASWIVDQPDYWTAMEMAAGSKEWPRCPERRHFRGQAALDSVASLRRGQGKYVFYLFSELIMDGEPRTAQEIIEVVKGWRGFGPWIAFKVADMLNALGIVPVTFDLATAMYKGSPTDAAVLLWQRERKTQPPSTTEACAWAVDRVLGHTLLRQRRAPPREDRPLAYQEAETILCKWKSHLGGHYHVGEDVEGVQKGLLRFGKCRTAQRLLRAGRGKLW